MATTTDLRGWFYCTRGEESLELIKLNPLAYVLASVIAHRGRWRDEFNRYGLNQGEAFLGDYASYGMSEQQYRTAKAQLEKHGFATFRSTNKGTIAKLTDTRLFSFFYNRPNGQKNGHVNRQPTSSQRTANGQLTTNGIQRELENVRTGEGNPPLAAVAAARVPKTSAAIIAELSASKAYQGIDVAREYAKMQEWCRRNSKQASEKRFVNWLNRIEIPIEQKTLKPKPDDSF